MLRVLEIRPRKFYCTRATFISVALSLGSNIKWIAEQCGTSVAMIEKNYGKYIRSDGAAQLKAYLEAKKSQKPDWKPDQTRNVRCLKWLASPTGFEPVLSA